MLHLLILLAAVLFPQAVSSFGHSPTPKLKLKPRPSSGATPDHDVIIIGGSIVGIATAVALSSPASSPSCSLDIAVYERARSTKPIGALLSIFPNGLTSLRAINADVARQVEQVSIPLRKSEIKSSIDGETLKCIESNASGDASNGTFLCWYQLQQILTSALQLFSGDVLKLGMELISYEVDDISGLVTVTCHDRNNDNEKVHMTCRLLIGADGVQSTVRRQLMSDDISLNSYNRTIYRALVDTNTLVDNSIVPPIGTAVIYKSDEVGQIFKIWAASDNTLAITATVNSNNDDATVRKWRADEAKSKMAEVYNEFAPEVRELIDQIPTSSIYANAVCDMDCLQTWQDGPVVVIGDGSHTMTPSLGQGANIGLEDAVEIAHFLRDALANGGSNTRIVEAIKTFVNTRKDRVREIHMASRMQALQKNKKDTTLGSFKKRDPAFFERLYGWQPTSFIYSSSE